MTEAVSRFHSISGRIGKGLAGTLMIALGVSLPMNAAKMLFGGVPTVQAGAIAGGANTFGLEHLYGEVYDGFSRMDKGKPLCSRFEGYGGVFADPVYMELPCDRRDLHRPDTSRAQLPIVSR